MAIRKINFFDLPAEVRNEVYSYLWPLGSVVTLTPSGKQSSFAEALLLDTPDDIAKSSVYGPTQLLQPLHICHQIRDEALELALGRTQFSLHAQLARPDEFLRQISLLSQEAFQAIKILTLTAKISQLRALNETWEGLPFGHPDLRLDKLIIKPQKPDAKGTCFAEIAELSQCHTLAHILTETLKSLRHVHQVEVLNSGCFKDFIWHLLYKQIIWRMWRWGGSHIGMLFECSEPILSSKGEEWLKVFIGDDITGGHEVGEEFIRLAGDVM